MTHAKCLVPSALSSLTHLGEKSRHEALGISHEGERALTIESMSSPQSAADASAAAATAPRAQILIVDDEHDHAETMADALRAKAGGGHVCTIVHEVPRALEELRHGSFDLIITDLRMPNSAGAHGVSIDGGDAGLRVLEQARKLQPQAETIMVTAHGDVPTARAAFKHGAFDFIEKPLDVAVFRALVNRAAEAVVLRHEAGGEMQELVQHQGFEGIIAGSEAMRRILRQVKTVAGSALPVLITGESGTGKELIAQAIHKNSPRAGKRFVALNCAAEAENLLEDQLFGHVRGAFTGAEKDREGVFEYASGGTLFLDEIGDMPLKMQAKLLRVLETGEIVRLGSNEPRKTDVRLVSATNKDIKAMAARSEQATFREDLIYRIAGATIHLPPLRDRREDVPRIVRHAIARFATAQGPSTPTPEITDPAMMRLTAYAWPGNVRQLLNVVLNMVVTALGENAMSERPVPAVVLDARHIPEEIRTPDEAELGSSDDASSGQHASSASAGTGPGTGAAAGGTLAGTTLEQLERNAIRDTLKLTGGNREHAAKLLGIGERTLYRKLKEYGLR
jgi:DNA-binding NtrC family response regulator